VEKILKKAVVVYLRHYSCIFLEVLRKTIKPVRKSGLRAEICTRDLSNTKQEC
jgi:hypothetical protein